jgi:acetylornithine deacetylase
MGNFDEYENKINNYLDVNADDEFMLLSTLISFDSQNFETHGNEKPCAEYIAEVYKILGLETELYCPDSLKGFVEHPAYHPDRSTDIRPNVDGVLWGSDRDSRVLVAAHIDTVPVGDPKKWTMDPFGGKIKDGKIFGLGAGDNKAGIAAGIFAVKALLSAGIKLKKTVVLNSYVDEEYGGGGGALGACVKNKYETIVNLDGGNFEVWTAALGGGVFRIEISSNRVTDTVVKTVDALYLVKQRIEEMGARRKAELAANPLYKGSDMERSAFRMAEFSSGNYGLALNTGSICFVIYTDKDYNFIKDEFADLKNELNRLIEPLDFFVSAFELTSRFFEYAVISSDDPAVKIMKECAEKVSGNQVKTCGACLSDLSIFMTYGSPRSFNFGIMRDFSLPGGAHQPDEYVSCKQFIEMTKAIAFFLLHYCG